MGIAQGGTCMDKIWQRERASVTLGMCGHLFVVPRKAPRDRMGGIAMEALGDQVPRTPTPPQRQHVASKLPEPAV